jgi:SAM-dependent methyltransferase
MRRRRAARQVREHWLHGRLGWLARAVDSQTGMAALTPRVQRVISLVGLAPGRRYLDIGCGTAAFANLVAARAGLTVPPVTIDIVDGPGAPEVVAWPEHLPVRDLSIDCLTAFYLVRRFDDDVVHAFADEVSRVLAPGGSALVLEIAPVVNGWLNRIHRRVVSGGCAEVDLRGWGRLVALFTECGFDAIDLVNVGPFLVPPVPRIGVLLRRRPDFVGYSAAPVEP